MLYFSLSVSFCCRCGFSYDDVSILVSIVLRQRLFLCAVIISNVLKLIVYRAAQTYLAALIFLVAFHIRQ